MSAKRKAGTEAFFATHPVFSLDAAAEALAPPGGRAGAAERLGYHVEKGRLVRVAREVFAVVPHGIEAAAFRPDPFLVASTVRPDGVFTYHAALELLGAAHSVWTECTLFTDRRRRSLELPGTRLRFLEHPQALRAEGARHMGTRRIERRGKLLRATGPERTLVEGFRRPARIGGLEELVLSAAGFPALDLKVLEAVLERYGERVLWATVGWFLERFQKGFHVPDGYLRALEERAPRAPRYLLRSRRGGSLASRWNLILPDELLHLEEPGER